MQIDKDVLNVLNESTLSTLDLEDIRSMISDSWNNRSLQNHLIQILMRKITRPQDHS